MEVLNLAATALFNSMEKHNLDRSLVIEGTGLTLDEMSKIKKKHRWEQFVRMYDNCAKYLGYDVVAKEVGYYGIYNENISIVTKVARSLIDVKSLYWYTATFVSKHLYKDSITFKYSVIDARHIRIEIAIRPDLKDCPILFDTYINLFEILPSVLGLPAARVEAFISQNYGQYDIYTKQTTIFKKLYLQFVAFFYGNTSSIELMEQLETQSEELSKVVEEKSQLLRIVSHDVSNQVITIDYYLNKLLESGKLSAEEAKILNIAKSSSSKLSNILKNVQNLEATSIRGVTLAPVDFGKILKYVKADFEPQLKHKNISLVCINELPENMTAMAEFSALETNVLGNLITNAIKFSSENSTIELSVKLEGENVLISVKDEGVGISPEERESIFTKKIRKSSVGTKGEMGTGFGLGIVTNYVRLFNGTISISSNEPQGTIFTIELKAHCLKK